MKDTPPEINARIFAAMMRRTPAERLMMCFDMMATGRAFATYQYNQSSGVAIRWKDSAGNLPPRD